MKISEAFKALGNQHLEEQNILGKGLSMGVTTVKKYIEEKNVNREIATKAKQEKVLAEKISEKLATKMEKQTPQMKI